MQQELLVCLHEDERRINEEGDQTVFERDMLISNPELWKELFGPKDFEPEGPGTIIKFPTTEEEFEEMIAEWEGDGYVPN